MNPSCPFKSDDLETNVPSLPELELPTTTTETSRAHKRVLLLYYLCSSHQSSTHPAVCSRTRSSRDRASPPRSRTLCLPSLTTFLLSLAFLPPYPSTCLLDLSSPGQAHRPRVVVSRIHPSSLQGTGMGPVSQELTSTRPSATDTATCIHPQHSEPISPLLANQHSAWIDQLSVRALEEGTSSVSRGVTQGSSEAPRPRTHPQRVLPHRDDTSVERTVCGSGEVAGAFGDFVTSRGGVWAS